MWINLSGSYAERSGGLSRIFVAEIDVVPDPMLPAKGEQDAKPPTAIFAGLAVRAARFGDIWLMGALLDTASPLLITRSRLGT